MFDTPQGRLSVRLLDQAVHVTRLWGGPDFHTDSYYLRTPTDWAYLDTLIAPLPELCLVFPDGEMDRVLCNSLTLTAADGTVRVLQEPDGWLPLTGPGAKYTVAAKLLGEDGTVYDVQYNFIFRT